MRRLALIGVALLTVACERPREMCLIEEGKAPRTVIAWPHVQRSGCLLYDPQAEEGHYASASCGTFTVYEGRCR